MTCKYLYMGLACKHPKNVVEKIVVGDIQRYYKVCEYAYENETKCPYYMGDGERKSDSE